MYLTSSCTYFSNYLYLSLSYLNSSLFCIGSTSTNFYLKAVTLMRKIAQIFRGNIGQLFSLNPTVFLSLYVVYRVPLAHALVLLSFLLCIRNFASIIISTFHSKNEKRKKKKRKIQPKQISHTEERYKFLLKLATARTVDELLMTINKYLHPEKLIKSSQSKLSGGSS